MSKKLVEIKDNGVYILNEDFRKKINKTNLSPSMINSWLSSPGDWAMDKFILPLIEKEKTPHLERGSWFHSIMEHFFKIPQTERNFKALKDVVAKVSLESYKHMLDNPEHKEWLKNALKGYYETWGNQAKQEKIANLYINGQNKEGLEMFVSGKIGNTKKNCLGYIDRIIEGESGLLVQDWKTGKTISNFDPKKAISESNPFDYWRQQIIYSILLEKCGVIVEGASLLFPCSEPPQEVKVDITSETAKNQVVTDCETVDRELSESIQNNFFFPFKKGQYNGWASYLCGLGKAKMPNIHENKLLMIADIL